MRKRQRVYMLIAAFFILVGAIPFQSMKVQAAAYWPEGPQVASQAAIVMEASTGTILYEKNIHDQHYPASITKIMTTLLALEKGNLSDTVTFSHDAVYNTEGSSIARDVGEQMTLEQCLYAVMLNSANECAYAVAEHIGGTMPAFVDMMNEKAKELGCQNTHFNNPDGLQDENHYTSAYDMALIARAAYQNETFRLITGTSRYTIPPTNKHAEETFLQNHNEMLYAWKTRKYLYDNCVGGKTGYTQAANSTLVTYAQKDGMTLICVVLDVQSPGQWSDTRSLFDYCFDNFQLVNVASNENRLSNGTISAGDLNTNKSYVQIDTTGNVVIPKTASFTDTVATVDDKTASGNILGTIQYTYADHSVGSANIITTKPAVKTFAFDDETETSALQNSNSTTSKKAIYINFRIILYVILAILAIAALGALFFFKLRKLIFPKSYLIIEKRTRSPYKKWKIFKFFRRRRK